MHYALLIWFIVPLGPVRIRTRRRFVIKLKIHACLNCPIPRNLSFIATFRWIVDAIHKNFDTDTHNVFWYWLTRSLNDDDNE